MNSSLANITVENAPEVIGSLAIIGIVTILGSVIGGAICSRFKKEGHIIGMALGGLVGFIGAYLALTL